MHRGKAEQLERNKQLRTGVRLKTVVTDVSNYPNDLECTGHGHAKLLTDGIDLAEVLSRHRFIDQTKGAAGRFIELVE